MTIMQTAPLIRPARRAVHLPRLLARLPGQFPADLNAHESRFGRLPLPETAWDPGHPSARRMAAALIDVVERSGLTGRGGAGFPAARKLRAVASGPGPAVVIANGAEGEPASRKDRLLLTRTPNLVLDGLALAAFAVGASEAYLAVHAGDERMANGLEAAAAARQVAGIDPVPAEVVRIGGGYVASEQSAIVSYLNGGSGLPTFSPPRTHERGVGNRATLVSNVETLAHLALIGRYGDTWFREAGLPSAPGTALVTVSGAVARPGVQEIELGTEIGEVVMRAGGPVERPRAILAGGYFGTWLPAESAWRIPMSQPDLRAAGAAMGAGILIVLGESSCGLAETARAVRYLAAESAGQCGPCVFGLPALADALAELAYHGGRGDAAERARRLIPLIEGRGACRHPDGATQLTASALAAFGRDAALHDHRGPCPGVGRPPLLPIPGSVEYW